MPVRHSVTWRPATQDEIERTGCADRANLIDGAGAVLVDGELAGICNEYGTCVWYSALDRRGPRPSGGEAMAQKDAIERLNEAAVEL